MYSSHTIIGNLGHEPELRYTAKQQLPVTTLNIATSSSHKDKNTGEWVDKTTWHRCVFAGKQAEYVCSKATKGVQMMIVGEPEDRSWKNAGGEKITVREIKVKTVKFPSGVKTTVASSSNPTSQQQLDDHQEWIEDYDKAGAS